MKTLASLYASGIDFKTVEHRFRDYQPPMDRIVAVLSAPQPKSLMTLGMPLVLEAHEERIGRRAVSVGPLIDDRASKLRGLLVRFHGVALHFHIDLDVAGIDEDREIVRPDMIDLIGPKRTSRLYLSWQVARHEGRIVELKIAQSRRPAKL